MYKDKQELIEAMVKAADALDQHGLVKQAGILDSIMEKITDVKTIFKDKDTGESYQDLRKITKPIFAYQRARFDYDFETQHAKLESFYKQIEEYIERTNQKMNAEEDASKKRVYKTYLTEAEAWLDWLKKTMENKHDWLCSPLLDLKKQIPSVFGRK